MADLIKNNKKVESAEFNIENIEEWALDCVMKDTASISKIPFNGEVIHLINDGHSGNFISNSQFKPLKLKKIIANSKSNRMEKATVYYDKAVLKFFIPERIHCVEDTFIIYSE